MSESGARRVRGPGDPTGVAVHVDRLVKTYWRYEQRLLRSVPVAEVRALGPVSLDVAAGEFVSIVGPSGCGKSTLLWIVAGLLEASSGVVRFDGPGGSARNPAAVVFQDLGLLPWRTARENVALAREWRGSGFLGRLTAAEWQDIDAVLDLVGLGEFRHARPAELSGGMQQRVAIARALAREAGLLLMDEPFGALDAQTRTLMQQELLRIHAVWQGTIVFVTHDIDEAVHLADRVVVLGPRPGEILRTIDVPLERPRDVVSTRAHPDFVALRGEIWQLLYPDTALEVRDRAPR